MNATSAATARKAGANSATTAPQHHESREHEAEHDGTEHEQERARRDRTPPGSPGRENRPPSREPSPARSKRYADAPPNTPMLGDVRGHMVRPI